ncbi:MAG: hypothetical protein CM15mP46_6130 [Alphaproteobacteria bacterium]|nr:MAG: hypothetical protein CM15mP46_6130 [Alphaproteobacteria bacterium]
MLRRGPPKPPGPKTQGKKATPKQGPTPDKRTADRKSHPQKIPPKRKKAAQKPEVQWVGRRRPEADNHTTNRGHYSRPCIELVAKNTSARKRGGVGGEYRWGASPAVRHLFYGFSQPLMVKAVGLG